MAESQIKIKSVSIQERCDVCHQSDMFDPETKFCGRCQHIALVKAIEQPKVNAAPLPEFLARRLSSNVAIRCSSCGEFIMSRSSACRHCGTYVRFDESARAAQDERLLAEASERLHRCKAASSLCWEFLRLHMWGFPLTLLVTPLSAVGSLVLFLRTLWLSSVSWLKFSSISQRRDPRVTEGRRETLKAAGKSAAVLLITAALGTAVIYSGVMDIPRFWDYYSKGRQKFDKGEWKDAEQLFVEAIKANPKDVDAHLYYARSISNQYHDDPRFDKERNRDVAARAIAAYHVVLDHSKDLKIEDEVYSKIAEIYKTTGQRAEFEKWMLDRVALPHQLPENQSDAYVKLGTVYGSDLSDLLEKYELKNSLPRSWRAAKYWEAEDRKRGEASATRALEYFNRALEVDPGCELAIQMRNHLEEESSKVGLKLGK